MNTIMAGEGAGSVCWGCLCGSRAVSPLGLYWQAYELFAPADLAVQVCWECKALLRKVLMFSSKVQMANNALTEYFNGPSNQARSLEILTKQCASALQCTQVMHTDYVALLESAPTQTETVDWGQIIKDEDDLAMNDEVKIKTELSFDDIDDMPLVIHKNSKVVRSKVKKKGNTVKKKRSTVKKNIVNNTVIGLDEEKEEPNFECADECRANESDHDVTNDAGVDDVEEMVTSDVTNMRKSIRKAVKKKVKGEDPKKVTKCKNPVQMAPEAERYRRILVSEQEQEMWRLGDSRDDRYATNRLPHKCTTCLLPFRWDEQLVRHNQKKHHPSVGSVVCDICECRFATEREMRSHRELHYTQYECLHCEYVSRDQKEIDKHYEMEHCEPNYHCTICGEAFKTFFQQRYHREAAHRPLWECQHCDKKFRLRGGLYSHMRVHQQLPKAACPICSKEYKNKYALMYHLRVHEQAKWPFYCQQCDVHFKSKNQLRLHMTTSMKHITPDKLKFACETCDRRFITEKRREHHHNSVHLNKTEFACSECSKAYANKQSLRSHVLRKHKQGSPPRDRICDICGKGFHNNVLLKNHMRSHTGERPFHCKLCPSTFSYSAALYTHNRLVHLKMKREKTYKKKVPAAPYPDKQWDVPVQY